MVICSYFTSKIPYPVIINVLRSDLLKSYHFEDEKIHIKRDFDSTLFSDPMLLEVKLN